MSLIEDDKYRYGRGGGRHDHYFVEKLKEDDGKAFEILFRTYYKELCGYALIYVRNLDVAEGLVQDLFVTIWEKRSSISIHTSFKAYLYRAVKNRCINYNRKVKLENPVNIDEVSDEMLRIPSFLGEIEEKELREALEMAIHALPERRKQIFLLHRQEGLSYPEIAEVLEISVNTVETQIMRALRSLRSHLSRFLLTLLIT